MQSVSAELAYQTNTDIMDWVAIDGPSSGCGVDYWFVHKETGRTAYCNWDQGYISVELVDD